VRDQTPYRVPAQQMCRARHDGVTMEAPYRYRHGRRNEGRVSLMEAEGEDLTGECGGASNAVDQELPCLFLFRGYKSVSFPFRLTAVSAYDILHFSKSSFSLMPVHVGTTFSAQEVDRSARIQGWAPKCDDPRSILLRKCKLLCFVFREYSGVRTIFRPEMNLNIDHR